MNHAHMQHHHHPPPPPHTHTHRYAHAHSIMMKRLSGDFSLRSSGFLREETTAGLAQVRATGQPCAQHSRVHVHHEHHTPENRGFRCHTDALGCHPVMHRRFAPRLTAVFVQKGRSLRFALPPCPLWTFRTGGFIFSGVSHQFPFMRGAAEPRF